MTTVRDLCRLLSATLHIPGVERWAEQLGSRELLPSLDHEVNDVDAALLLAGIVAAPRPEDAPRVVVSLARLPLISTRRRVDGPEIETWARGTDTDIAAMPDDPLDALATAIEQEPFPEDRFYFGSLRVEEGAASAELLGWLDDNLRGCRAQYYLPASGLPSGLTRFVELHADVIGSIATEMWPPAEHVAGHDQSTLTH